MQIPTDSDSEAATMTHLDRLVLELEVAHSLLGEAVRDYGAWRNEERILNDKQAASLREVFEIIASCVDETVRG